jgi:hypothetical protein
MGLAVIPQYVREGQGERSSSYYSDSEKKRKTLKGMKLFLGGGEGGSFIRFFAFHGLSRNLTQT